MLLGAAAAAMIGITSDREEPVSLIGSSSGRRRRVKPSLSSHSAMYAARCSAAWFQQRVCQLVFPLEVWQACVRAVASFELLGSGDTAATGVATQKRVK